MRHPPVANGPNGPINYNLGNGLTSVFSYDSLGRPNGGWVCNGSTSASCSDGTETYGFTNSWKGVQLQNSSDTALGQTSTYGYDQFNRLASRTVTAGTAQNFTYSYDRWGNRWSQTVTSGSGPQPSYGFNTSTNQITAPSGYTYDAAGNMTSDGSETYTYDAEGNIVQVDSGSTAAYLYDALNHRARTVVGSAATEFVFNQNGQRVSVWNATTKTVERDQYYWGGKPVAFTASGATHFQHQDWLGTERARTTYDGTVEGTYASLPFGDGYTPPESDLDPYHYAQLDYDSESNTSHAQYRQDSTTQGRWMSPDPYYGSYVFTNPQTFNRYSYTLNNPLGLIDPLGLTCVPADETDTDDDGNVTVTAIWLDNGDGLGCNPGGGSGDGGDNGGTDDGYDGSWNVGSNPNDSAVGLPQSGGWNAPNNGPTWSQKNQNCLNTINNTPDGKFYNFFSPLSMIPGIGPEWKSSIAEDVGGGAAKYVAFKFFQGAGTNWAGTGLGSIGQAVSGTIEGVAEGVLAPVAAAATVGQLTVHAGCAISAAF